MAKLKFKTPEEEAKEAQVRKLWIDTIQKNASKVDRDNEHDWTTLAYGFLLGQGYEPKRAYAIALNWSYELLIA